MPALIGTRRALLAVTPTAALSISGTPAAATVGAAFSFVPTVSGGSGSKVFGIDSGSLPAGMSFSTATGAITGTPTGVETDSLVIRVTDASGYVTLGITITVAAGSSYPAGVIAANAQTGYDQRNITGWTASPTQFADGVATLPSGWAYSSTYGLTTISSSPAALAGWDTNGRPITIRHNNATVRQCKITNDGTYNGGLNKGGVTIGDGGFVDSATVEYCEIDGKGATQTPTIFFGIQEHGSDRSTNTTIRSVYIHGCAADDINVFGAPALIELNRLCIGGWRSVGAHSDAMDVEQRNGTGTTTIRHNFIDLTPDATAGISPLLCTMGRTSAMALNLPLGAAVYGNVVVGSEVYDSGIIESPPQSGTAVQGTPSQRAIQFYINSGSANVDFDDGAGTGNATTFGNPPTYTTIYGLRNWTMFNVNTGASIAKPAVQSSAPLRFYFFPPLAA